MTSTQRRALLRAAIPLSVDLLAAGLPRAHAQSAKKLIRGAGATFPAPLYQKWIEAFEAARPEIDVEYDAVGSGEGVSRLVTGSVDFAASDAAMTDEQIARVEGGVRMIPATAGLVAIIYNVPGLTAPLRLPRDLLPAIFIGEVAEWDDPRIAAANPGVSLPSRTIALVAPSIASGEAALAGSAAELPENLRLFIADPAGGGSYPIATFSWLLLYATSGDAATRAAVADFVRFGLTDGQAFAADLGYVLLPAAVAERSLSAITGLT